MSIIAKLKSFRKQAFVDEIISIHKHLPTGVLGKKSIAPPDVVVQDNTKMLTFTVDTDDFFYSWEIPADYAGGDLGIVFHWTNDGGVDDLNKNVKARIDYQVFSEGDSIAGSHANSPKNADDTYTSASGWVPHTTPVMTIAKADFIGEHEMTLRGSFVTADPTVLTCEPHLISVGVIYNAYVNR